jgi:4-amino-4-deoxy-L-arabinose transferase-like glycosyltransferase
MPFIKKIALILIVIVGLFLYLYKLDVIPAGFYVDEALTGYNAYSILKTSRDEYGKLYPIALRFFGSYSPPLYTYLTIPFISIFGLNITSVRLLSAIVGALGGILVFAFLKSLKITRGSWSPLLGAFLFIISPWNVLFSRVGYEVNLAFFIFSLGLLATWIGLKKPKYLVLGFSLLSISTYAAHTQRFLVPLFIISFLILFRPNKKFTIYGLISALVIQIPNLYLFTTPAFFTKSSLFYSNVLTEQALKISRFLPMAISVPLAFIREFLSQFFDYFSPRSLFLLSDPDPQRSMPELAVLYPWMVIPYLVGFYALFKNISKEKAYKYILLLAIMTPLPVALVGDPFSSQRALPLLLPIILIITIGVDRIILGLSKRIWLPVFLFLVVSSFVLLWRSYFVFLPKERAKVWGYGFEQLADQIKKRPNERFVIDQGRIKPAYIELLFFLKYSPEKFQKEVDQLIKKNYYKDVVFKSSYNFGNIETRNISWEEDVYKEQILVGDELAISSQQAKEHVLDKVFEIRSPVDEIIFLGYKTNPDKKCLQTPNNIHCKGI